MNVRNTIFLSLLFLIQSNLSAQFKGSQYPKGQFIFPIKPYSQASLSGSFGDIRINHFHAGWDIRTGGVEGIPVNAVGDGYVSRINISTSGYGNALYITHPNGFTSVYAHLQEFSDKIKQVLLNEQYKNQTFSIDFNLPPGVISISKGEIVALSGNTGGSGGPHLHFEIRDESENAIDPAFFGFSEVVDSKPPLIDEVQLIPLSIDARINGEFKKVTFKPVFSNGSYQIPNTIRVAGEIGIQLLAYDKSETSPFRLGISTIKMKYNNQELYQYNLEKLSFENKLDMNLHTDYDEMLTTGKKYHKCYVEEGNTMQHYTTINAGKIRTASGSSFITIQLNDVFGNATFFSCNFIQDNSSQPIAYIASQNPIIKEELIGDILKIEVINGSLETKNLLVSSHQSIWEKPYNYISENKKVYLINLNETDVDEVKSENTILKIAINASVSASKKIVKGTNFEIDFTDALYHTQHLSIKNLGNELIIDKDEFPLKNNFSVKWIPNVSQINSQIGVYLKDKKLKFIASEWRGNVVYFNGKELGTYTIGYDGQAPSILPKVVNSSKLVFTIRDNLSGIKEIKCLVNNEWVLMEYEPKQSLIWSEKLNNMLPFSGKVELYVTDNCNNTAYYEKYL